MRRILIILLAVILIGAGVWYFYIRPKQMAGTPLPGIITTFFPKSSTGPGGSFGSDNTLNGTGGDTNATPSPLKQITGRPVAGYTIFSLTNTVSIPSADPKAKPIVQSITDQYIRYVSRLNGYVYEIKDNGIALQVSNIFIPNVYEAFFADSNNTAILRFLRPDNATIATYSVPIPSLNPDGTRTQKPGVYLSDNISAMAVSPDQAHIVRVISTKNGSTITASTTNGTGIKPITTSSFQEWLPQWTTSGVYLQTKAASVANGFIYSVDPTARLRRVLGDVTGLTTSVSPSGTYVLYSESTDGGFTTRIFNTKTNTTRNIGLEIMPEKCAWLQNENLICAGNTTVDNNNYPDAWYAGTTHFSDQLYQITTVSNVFKVLYDGAAQSFDMTNIQIDEGKGLVYFVDKNTGLLWQYKY